MRVIASSRTTGSSSPLTRIALRAGNIVQNSSANAPSSGKYSRCGFFPEFHGCGRSHERGRSSRYEPWLTSGVFDLVARCFINSSFHSNQHPADDAGSTATASQISRSVQREASFGRRFRRRKVRQSGHARVKMPPHYCSTLARSMFAEWGLKSRRILVAGCSE